MIDGSTEPTSAAHVDQAGQITVGNAAWRLAATDPDGFVGAPRAERSPTITRHGRSVALADLVAATLRLFAAEANRILGSVPDDVRLTVPAGWGPRRRTWLRSAANQAGLGLPQLVDAPIAAADQQLRSGVQLPVGAFVLICDVGATTEATVLRRGPAGFEVLSTLEDANAGGHAIDQQLAGVLVPAAGVEGGTPSWPLLASMRTGKEAVSHQPAVTVPLPPPDPAVVLNAALVEQAAAPVLQRAADLAAAAVEAAELTPANLSAVYAVGAAAAMPALRPALEQRLGVEVQVPPAPGQAVVLGAADATAPAGVADAVAAPPAPPLRRILGLLLPGLLALGMFLHMVFSANMSGSRVLHTRPWWVMANYGELVISCLLVLAVCLAAGPWLGAVLAQDERLRGRWDGREQLSAGLVAGTVIALIVATLFAVCAALYFIYPYRIPLRWALLPILPIAAVAITFAVIIRRRPYPPAGGWEAFLAFPMTPLLIIAVGDLVFAYVISSWWVWAPHVVYVAAKRIGVALIGVGIGMLLVRVVLLRAIAATTLGVFGFFITDWRLQNPIGVAVAVAVLGWWMQRLWTLLR
ncbi:Ethanolamine utilization protein EutJ (predicted chaperonin) [Actinoplanes octamycinicus]|uniref:Ethanolamine utilization protein EutJ (Predicted chaperonin) n=1 Tax=Actinoplanes octamycinicus TaxID=135948 RepID=A0A7W7H4Y4_9ACTN|nr:Hsp70 family protein [Actinoplanes octamycinicus]MBB4743937.1 Ethanolamine utilization protein EutJ (predicted chaperonin) [Actinoplanes octamycinicus]